MIIEDIDFIMDMTGADLTFSDFTIKGLANYMPETLYNGDYKVEKQDFRFLISSKACKENGITPGLTFTHSDGIYLFTFKITNQPIFDLTGYVELLASYVSKEEV
ncbi:MAG: hypothetical protein M0R47_19035 [Methylobacter sp.]|jgi:hypothetical protein|uniref:hypothetical protein n=1 Tax=Methylobacter sp. TaxID=2051955 RepID=UPI0025F8C2F3|nr:hypothetical protein [Methylobacter sp.]MCK9622617.1 hypothetical protein [Methylobacter sp.]